MDGRARRQEHSPPEDSVTNVSQIVTLDKVLLTERVSKLPAAKVALVLTGIDIGLGR